jgi:1-acyl-sn-glycerol-3-phosphate acyltransferase|tara:strand:- start:843 stop:1397 length:555 start_codon:yes stop_codon:yes gene_type:complete
LLIKLTSKGEKNIPKKGPYILAPNHFSLLDPFVLQAKHKKPTTFLMAEDLDDLGWKELWAPWLYGVLLVHRKTLKPSTIRAIQNQIEKKEPICIFPEGTSIGARLKPPKEGAAYFSARNNIPIIPVALSGTDQISKKINRLQRPEVSVEFGKPICPKGTGKEETEALTKKTMQALKEMLPKKYH